MELLKDQDTSWKKLDKILTGIVQALNWRTPRKGNGILLTENPSGVLISIDPQIVQTSQGAGGAGAGGGVTDAGPDTAGWRQMIVIDSSDCSQRYIWYWGTSPTTGATNPPATRPVSVPVTVT